MNSFGILDSKDRNKLSMDKRGKPGTAREKKGAGKVVARSRADATQIQEQKEGGGREFRCQVAGSEPAKKLRQFGGLKPDKEAES